jgi:iron complex transport system permease protein
MLGIRDGATVGVMVTVLGTGSGMIGAWWAGPLGGAVAAAVVVLLAGGLAAAGQRFIVMGLAISTTLASLVDLALSSMSLHTSAAVYTWSIGSLNGRDYSVAAPVAIGLAALLPFALLAGRRLDVLRFDQDTSAGLGLHPARTRLFVLAVAVLLAGLGVGVGGPIGFVAMAAPVVASRFCGPTRVPVMASALLGALLVVLSDTLGRTAGTGAELPVGVVTSILGGPFLLWVLLTDRSARRF